MRKLRIIFTLLGVVLIVTATVVIAQDDEPNLCTNGAWHCADPENPAREEWNYTCGWYLGQYEAGNVTAGQVPIWCADSLVLAIGCYGSTIGYPDMFYYGPMGVPGNAVTSDTLDGSCSALVHWYYSVWFETDLTSETDVLAYCQATWPDKGFMWAYNPAAEGFAVPDNVWECFC